MKKAVKIRGKGKIKTKSKAKSRVIGIVAIKGGTGRTKKVSSMKQLKSELEGAFGKGWREIVIEKPAGKKAVHRRAGKKEAGKNAAKKAVRKAAAKRHHRAARPPRFSVSYIARYQKKGARK